MINITVLILPEIISIIAIIDCKTKGDNNAEEVCGDSICNAAN